MKSHLTYQGQVALLQSRGLTYESLDRFLEALKNIGYYRFSGYLYPFRDRDDNYLPGTTFEEVVAVYNLDHSLRVIWRDALDVLETALAAQVSYRLGLRSPTAHLETDHLDSSLCNQRVQHQGKLLTVHEHWLAHYGSLRSKSKLEDYSKHHQDKYGNLFPIWVATEFLDFGALVRLYKLMKPEDKLLIAAHFGVQHDTSGLFDKWLEALNIVRNTAAHNGRLWNRAHVKFPPKPPIALVGAELQHLRDINEPNLGKTYPLLAITAYMMKKLSPRSLWHTKVREIVEAFGTLPTLSYIEAMGFPDVWSNLALWT